MRNPVCVCVSVPQGTEGSLREAQTEFRLGLGRAGWPTWGHARPQLEGEPAPASPHSR